MSTILIEDRIQSNYINTVETTENLDNLWLISNVTTFDGSGNLINVYSNIDKNVCPILNNVYPETVWGNPKPRLQCLYKLEDFKNQEDIQAWIDIYGKDTYYTQYLLPWAEQTAIVPNNLTGFNPIKWVTAPISKFFKGIWKDISGWIWYVLGAILVVAFIYYLIIYRH